MPITVTDYRKPGDEVPISVKVGHVLKAKKSGHTGGHHCHWPGCSKECAPAQWGCSTHWFKLPKYLRDKIWKAYKPGQEVTKDPSSEYTSVAREVQRWIRTYQKNAAPVVHQPTLASSKGSGPTAK